MATFREEYEEWKKKKNEGGSSSSSSSSFADEYRQWKVQNGHLDIESIGNEISERVNTWLRNNENYVSNARNRFSGKNTSYRSDASDWLSTVTTQKSNFEKEAEGIKAMLEQYKSFFNEDYVNSVTQALDGNLKVQGDILSASTKDFEYWSQWETEDAYKEYIAQQKEYEEKLNYDLEAGQAELDGLKSIVAEYEKVQVPAYSNSDRGYSAQAKSDAYNAQMGAIANKYGISYADAKAQLSEKSAYHTLAERAQKAAELASVADVNSENYDVEFEKYATQGQKYQNPSIQDAEKGKVPVNKATYAKEHLVEIGLAEFNGAGGSDIVNAYHSLMTDEEVRIYSYYFGKGDYEKADEYLEILEETLLYRQGSAMGEALKGKPVLEYTFAVAAGLDQFATGVRSIFADGYTPASATQVASGIVREDLANTGAKLPDWLGGASLGQVGYDILNTTSNMLPSILTSAAVNAVAPGAGAVVGAGLMGASAGGHAKAEMLNLGYSKEQANVYGLMVGAAEAGMEYLLGGISKLGGKASGGLTEMILSKVDNAFARTAIKIGGSMLSEGFEEGLQTVIEPWLKEIATSVDWEDPKIDEVLYSSLLGALSAFGLEGAGVVAGEVGTHKSGKTIQKIEGGVAKLQELGSTFSADTVAYKIASKVNAQTDAYTIGRLLNEVGGTISELNLTDIVNGLTERGIRESDAKKIAKEYQNALYRNMNLSDEQVKILESLSPLADVLRKNIIGANTTTYQRTRAYSDLMGLANEVANGKKGVSTQKSSTTEKTSANIFEQQALNADVQRIASEVATGTRTSAAGQAVKKAVNSASDMAAEKLGVEGKYTSSETGATRLASNKKKVNVVGVDSIDKGTLKLKLGDGSIVDAEDIDFSTADQALVYEAVTNMGVNPTTAWEILKGYDPKSGQSGTIYAMGVLEAYTYGHNGVKVDKMSNDGFSALLSPVQKNTANRLGDIDARAKVEAQQKAIDKAEKTVRDEAKSKHKAIPKRKGGVVLHTYSTTLTDLQQSQIDVLERVSEGLGVTFHMFESKEDAKGNLTYIMPDGTVTGSNGWYDPKTGEIWIDINAGKIGQGTIIFTAAHELTHFIKQWSPAKFKVFADFLFEQYGKKGQSIEQLVNQRIESLKSHGRTKGLSMTEIYDLAYEEIVADSAQAFLRDSKAAEKIAALREKDKGLANKIKTFLGQMLAKMRKVLEDHNILPESNEAQIVAEMTDSLQKLYDLWSDALADAGEAYSTLAEIDFNTDSVAPLNSERTWTASEYVTEREETAKKISEALDVDIKTAYKYIDDINSIARLIADDRARLDYEPNLDANATVLKPNSEYKYSVDMSTLCAKRLLFTGTFDAIQKALPNTVFDSEDIVALREMMQKRGYEVACGICYVESTRREIGRITQEFIDRYKVAQETGKPISRINSSGKEVVLKSAGKTFNADKNYTPNLGELNTTDIDIVKRDHPEVYEAYLAFMNARGQAKPKLLETRAEYKGEILKHFKAKSAVEARNNAGGLRLQSFSDFEVPHLIDMMQVVMDMSRVGLKSQAYTKVPAFAEVFGNTGVKINLSLIAKGDGLDANGNLVFDDVEGINHNEAFKLRDKYSKNVGTILVGKTDAHIIAAMADPRIDYIIPFHKSSWKESLYDALGLTGYADYTDYQNEKPIDKDRKIKNFDPSEYWDFSKSGDENAQIYLAKCREDGRIPKFPQFQGYPGYWKLLIDFKMYDNDGVGSPQEVVKPEFNTEASERILAEYKGGHKSFPVAKDVVEDFVKEHKDKVKFSDRYSYEALTSKPDMKLTMVGGTVSTNRADVVLQAKKNAASVGKTHKDGSVSVYVKDVDANVVLSKKGLLHGLDRRLQEIAPVTVKAGEIIQNSIKINDLTPSKEEADASYILIGAAQNPNGDLYIVRSVVNKFSNELDTMDVLYAINAKKSTAALNAPLVSTPNYRTTISIAQLLDFVNRYFPDILPESVLKHYGYDARPEGELGENVLYSDRVTDKKTLDFLENQEHVTVYRAMQIIDGKLYPPMNAYTKDQNGKTVLMPPSEIGAWEQSVERPDLIDPKTGKFKLDKGKVDSGKRGTAVPAAYNPYIHTSLSMLNDQFTSAYQRSNLVVVKGVVPKSELTSGYRAQYAKDSVGETEWHSGVVSTQLPESRKVILSRWFKPVEIVKNDDVAESIKKMLSGTSIEIPYNVVSPGLRRSLEKIGVPIGEGRGIRGLPKKDEVKYSDRDPNAFSSRSLLANALETTAQNDIERRKLEQYKSKIEIIESEYARLSEVKAELKELSFPPKGTKKDTARINALRFEENEISNRINTYDRQLLNLESTKALKNVLQREKELVRKREVQRSKQAVADATLAGQMAQGRKDAEKLRRTEDAFAEYKENAEKKQQQMADHYRTSIAKVRENAAKTQRALMDKNTESRKKAVDRRKMSDIRTKIKNFKKKLESSLLHPTDRQYIPLNLVNAMIDVFNLIDTDTPLYKPNGELNKAQASRDLTKEKLQALKDEYEALKTNADPMYSEEFDEVIYKYLTKLQIDFKDKSLADMSLAELEEMYEILKSIGETLQEARKVIGWGDASEVYEAGNTIVAEQAEITQSRKEGKRNAAQRVSDQVIDLTLSPVRNVERMSGYREKSPLLRLFKDFERGVRKKNMFVMEANKDFEALSTGENAKQYEEAIYNAYGDKTYTDVNGRKFGISKMQMMQTILSYERETANKMHHIEGSGFTFADLDMLRKGKLKEAVSEEYSHRVPSAVAMVQAFTKELENDKWAQDYMAAARKFFDGKAKDAVNETYITLKHRIIARDKNYIPFEVDKNFVVREISAQNDIQQTINSYGMLQDTKDGASQPLIITGLNNILDRHIDQVGNVYGLAVPIRNFNKVWNVRSVESNFGGDPTVQAAIQRNWGLDGTKVITQAVQDLQGARPNTQSELYKKAKSGYIGATFALNLSVVTKQIGSLFSATSMLKWRNPVKMIGNLFYTMANHKKISAEVDKYTASVWMRRQGLSDAELHTLVTQSKKPGFFKWLNKLPTIINPTKWITSMDTMVALSLWKYAKQDTAKRTGLTGEELLKATAEFYDSVIENTQSMTDVLHRPEIQKRNDVISEAFGMFKTDLYQTAGQLQTALGRYMHNKSKENGAALARTVYSATASAIWGSLMTTLFALLRYKVKQYRDDEDDELTMESWLKRQTFGFFGDIVGYVFPLAGGEFMGLIENIMYGESEDVVDSLALTAINDLYNAFVTIGSAVKDGEMPSAEDWEKLVMKSLQIFGVPANNVKRTVTAIRLHAEDIANGEFFSFEAGKDKTNAQALYDAVMSGNDDRIGKAKEVFDNESEIKTALKQGLRENDSRIKKAAKEHSSGNIRGFNGYIEAIASEGHFDKETIEGAIRAEQSAFNTKINKAAEAKTKGDDNEYKKIVRELRDSYKGIYTQDEIVELIKKAQEEQAKNKTDDDTEEATSIYKASDINLALESGDTEMALEIIDNLFNTKVENALAEARRKAEKDGKRFNERTARQEAETDAKSSIKSPVTSYWKKLTIEAFANDNKTELLRIRDLLFSTGLYGKNLTEVYNTMKDWNKKS